MLAGPGLKGRIAQQQFAAFAQSSRSMSSFRPQTSRFPVQQGRILGGNTTWRASVPSIAFAGARFNSTSSPTPGTFVPETPQSTEWDLSQVDITNIPEHIGYLKDLGLDYGWGPSAMMEFLIEHIHIYSGLPWLGSIIATGLIVRSALLPFFFRSVNSTTKLANTSHITAPIKEEMFAANKAGNLIEAQRKRAEWSQKNRDLGIKTEDMFIPMLLQIPLGYGCYRTINGMSHLPVPGLASEHFAWITDLTVCDPYFIIPIATSLFLHLSLRKGGEFGNMNQASQTVRKALMYGLPFFQFIFFGFMPAALQLYFLTTTIFALGQTYALSSNAFRKMVGIETIIRFNQTPASTSGGPDASRALRMITEAMERENAKIKEATKNVPGAGTGDGQQISFIDRAINNIKDTGKSISKEAQEKMQEMSGKGPAKNADGTLAEPPRLSEKDRKLAESYEKRRKEEEEWKREERNHARRGAYMKQMEQQREKAKSSFRNR
ncbi:membrane insertase OXA1 [Aspergillus undulatus]|uniref:membrane insertase OXA1 n=1 Tax=Aspergillus undulatus TaxID=1810928 RepID=UPI003CCD27D6